MPFAAASARSRHGVASCLWAHSIVHGSGFKTYHFCTDVWQEGSLPRLTAASASVVTGSEVLLVPNGPRYGIVIRVYHSDGYECRPERKPSAA